MTFFATLILVGACISNAGQLEPKVDSLINKMNLDPQSKKYAVGFAEGSLKSVTTELDKTSALSIMKETQRNMACLAKKKGVQESSQITKAITAATLDSEAKMRANIEYEKMIGTFDSKTMDILDEELLNPKCD